MKIDFLNMDLAPKLVLTGTLLAPLSNTAYALEHLYDCGKVCPSPAPELHLDMTMSGSSDIVAMEPIAGGYLLLVNSS